MQYTPLSEIPKIHHTLNESFRSGKTLSVEFRKQQLARLAYLLKENVEPLCSALKTDLGRAPTETLLGDISIPLNEAIHAYEHVASWARDIKPSTTPTYALFNLRIKPSPKGVVLIISPFNYPILLSLAPLVGAIAAGCTVVLKLPESLDTFSPLLEELIKTYLDPEVVRVVQGSVTESTELLKLQWDHILFTGSPKVGSIVGVAAAKFNTPTTMELGGKCPVIVDPRNSTDNDYRLIARRILWGRNSNSGQTCTSPEYVLIPSESNSDSQTSNRSPQNRLVGALKEVYKEFYPDGAQASDSLARILNPTAAKRISSYLDPMRETPSSSVHTKRGHSHGKLVVGGSMDAVGRFVEPSIVCDVPIDSTDKIMQEEIFGPLLSIVPVASFQEAIDYINARPAPLALYLFSKDRQLKDKVTRETRSGSIIFNDVVLQVGTPGLPMGGTGASGHGQYKGKYGFDTFTHFRSSLETPTWIEKFIMFRYPPFTPKKHKIALNSLPSLPFDKAGRPTLKARILKPKPQWFAAFVIVVTLLVTYYRRI